MKKSKFLKYGAAVFIFVITATHSAHAQTIDAGNGWSCTAEKIVSAKYDGGARAYIHLDPYSKGDRYRVKMNETKTEATGKTGNKTVFVCKKG